MSSNESDFGIELPLIRCTAQDVCGALFPVMPAAEPWKSIFFKLQTWIMNYAEEQIRPLAKAGIMTAEELERLKASVAVISPITVSLYVHCLQEEQFSSKSDMEKERWLLEKVPDRFKARFKGNLSCRNARELTEDEIAARESSTSESLVDERREISLFDVVKDLMQKEPPQYVKEFLSSRVLAH